MSIKYGEFAVIHNKEEESIFTYIYREWFDNEVKADKSSQIVILFEDGEICEINDKLKDFHYKFLDDSTMPTPRYFDKKTTNEKEYKKIYFKKDTEIINGIRQLNLTSLFKNYSKYAKENAIASAYNSIYYHHKNSDKPDIFGIVRIKSSESKPRFQFAYNSDEFSKEEVIYLINYIFYKL